MFSWTTVYAGDFYVIPGMKKNFAPVPKTGQTLCYDAEGNPIGCSGTGQDGDHRKGVAWPDPRFKDNGDGTVTDNLTGLIWLKDSTDMGSMTWTGGLAGPGALAACNGLADGSCGLEDGSEAGNWRLPNIRELYSLVDISQYSPALPDGHPFIGFLHDIYWSSSTFAGNPRNAWRVIFSSGSVGYHDKTLYYYVRCVRSGR